MFTFLQALLLLIGLVEAIDQCVNLWEPMSPGTGGSLYKELYTNWPNYDKYTRISKVCIWTDDAPINGAAVRVNGLQFTTKQVNTGVETQQALCYGACIDTETCTDVQGEIIQIDYWYSAVTPTRSAIDHIKFSTSTGQAIFAGTGEVGSTFQYQFDAPFLGVYVYYSATSLDDIGIYHGLYDDPACTCCSSTTLRPASGLTTMTYAITDPPSVPTTITYDSQIPECGFYLGNTEDCGALEFSHSSTAACPFVTVTSAQPSNYEVTVSVSTTDPLVKGEHTCTQRSAITGQSPQVPYLQDFQVIIQCQIDSFVQNPALIARYWYIMDQAVDLEIPFVYLQTPLCGWIETYTAQLFSSGFALPTYIKLDTPNQKFVVNTDAVISRSAQDGIYDIQLSALLDDPFMTLNNANIFDIAIVDCLADSFVPQTIGPISYIVRTTALTETFPEYENQKSIDYGDGTNIELCGERTYALSDGAGGSVAHFITIDVSAGHGNDKVLSVQTNDDNMVGTHTVTLTVSLTDYGAVTYDETFDVVIDTCLISYTEATPLSAFTYNVGQGPQVLAEAAYTLNPPTCGYTETKIGSMVGVASFPSFISFTQGVGFTVDTSDIFDFGIYQVSQKTFIDDYVPTTYYSGGLISIDPCPATALIDQQIENMACMLTQSDAIVQQLSEFLDTVGQQVKSCGARTVTLLDIDTGQAPSFLSFNQVDNKLRLVGAQSSKSGSFNIQMSVSLTQYPAIAPIVKTFVVTVLDRIYPPSDFLIAVNFTLGNDTLELPFDDFWSNKYESSDFIYTSTLENGDPLPPFILLDQSNRTYTVRAATSADAGTYQVVLRVGLVGYPDFSLQFPWEITIAPENTKNVTNSDPYVELDYVRLRQFAVDCGQPWSYTMPKPQDHENHYISTRVDISEAGDFMEYNQWTRTFSIASGLVTEDINGSYLIKIFLHDQMGGNNEYQFEVQLYCVPTEEERRNATIVVVPPPDPVELLSEGLDAINETDFSEPYIYSVSRDGLMRLRFKREIKGVEAWMQIKNKMISLMISEDGGTPSKVARPLMEVNIQPGLYSSSENLKMEWFLVELTSTYMDIQLEFETPWYVSSYQFQDLVSVTFWSLEPFMVKDLSQNDEVYCEENNELCFFQEGAKSKRQLEETEVIPAPKLIKAGHTIKRPLRSQLVSFWDKVYSIIAMVVAGLLVLLIVFSMITSYVAYESHMRLFLSLSHFSMLTHLCLLNIQLPASASALIGGVSSNTFRFMALRDALSTRNGLYQFEQEDLSFQPVIPSFVEFGYQSTLFTRNLGMLPYVYIFGVLLWLLGIMLRCRDKKKYEDRTFTEKGASIIKFVLRVFFPFVWFCQFHIVAVCAMINIVEGPSNEESHFNLTLQYFASAIALVLCVVYPVYIYLVYFVILESKGLIMKSKLSAQVVPTDLPASQGIDFEKGEEQIQEERLQLRMDSILEEASLNIERNEKLANFGLNYGVFVQDFHVMRVRAGLLYLATLLSVQFALSFIYLTMQSYPCFQLLLVFSLITCLLLVLRFGEPFVDKKDKIREIINLGTHLVMLTNLTSFTAWTSFAEHQLARTAWGWSLVGLVFASLLYNFVPIAIAAFKNIKLGRLRYKLRRYNVYVQKREDAKLAKAQEMANLAMIREEAESDKDLSPRAPQANEQRDFSAIPSDSENDSDVKEKLGVSRSVVIQGAEDSEAELRGRPDLEIELGKQKELLEKQASLRRGQSASNVLASASLSERFDNSRMKLQTEESAASIPAMIGGESRPSSTISRTPAQAREVSVKRRTMMTHQTNGAPQTVLDVGSMQSRGNRKKSSRSQLQLSSDQNSQDAASSSKQSASQLSVVSSVDQWTKPAPLSPLKERMRRYDQGQELLSGLRSKPVLTQQRQKSMAAPSFNRSKTRTNSKQPGVVNKSLQSMENQYEARARDRDSLDEVGGYGRKAQRESSYLTRNPESHIMRQQSSSSSIMQSYLPAPIQQASPSPPPGLIQVPGHGLIPAGHSRPQQYSQQILDYNHGNTYGISGGYNRQPQAPYDSNNSYGMPVGVGPPASQHQLQYGQSPATSDLLDGRKQPRKVQKFGGMTHEFLGQPDGFF